jgi:SNF2 family DNA or RNA helicase
LDLLGQLLNEQKVQFVRIDGTVSYAERSKRLSKFQQSSDISALLMTFGTGAVG